MDIFVFWSKYRSHLDMLLQVFTEKSEKVPILNWILTRERRICNRPRLPYKLLCFLGYMTQYIQGSLKRQIGLPLEGLHRQVMLQTLRILEDNCAHLCR